MQSLRCFHRWFHQGPGWLSGLLFGLAVLGSLGMGASPALGQVSAAAHGVEAVGRMDVAASVYGSFPGSTTGNGVVQSPSNAAGVLLEMRYLGNPLVGYELNYSYNPANQTYNTSPVTARAQQVGAAWVVHAPALLNMKLFALAGAGIMFFNPESGQAGTQSNTKPVFVYGGGLDYGLLPHLGLRFQYRGNLYHAPDLATAFSSTGKFTRASQPMLGAYFRF